MQGSTIERTIIKDSSTNSKACQGDGHPTGSQGHVLESPGEITVFCPNCGFHVLQCSPQVEYLFQNHMFMKCPKCDIRRPMMNWIFIS